MEKIIKQIKEGAKHTRLSSAEKTAMRAVLLSHMKANPAESHLVSRRAIPSPFSINSFRNRKGLTLAVIGGLLMSGSVSFAAENTVPGDVLFPVKIHINESVRGTMAVTPKAKAEWGLRLVERRFLEVEKLAVTPNALPKAQQVAQQNLVSYTQSVKDAIVKFEEDEDSEDAIATASGLSNVLSTHEQILSSLATNQNATALVSGTTATITLGVLATSTTATAVASVATTTPASSSVTVLQNDVASLLEILGKIREARGHAEEKQKELEEKYHPEVKAEEEKVQEDFSDLDSEDGISASWNPMPNSISFPVAGTTTVLAATASTTISGNATTTLFIGTTASSTVFGMASSTATSTASRESHSEGHESNKEVKREGKQSHEVETHGATSLGASVMGAPAPRPAESHIESSRGSHND